jgi:serine O-acetyltransferase
MMTTLRDDLVQLASAASSPGHHVTPVEAALRTDAFTILSLHRLQDSRVGRRIPMLRWLVRRVLTALYGIELGRDIVLGPGVYFVHTSGVVIGGDARVGARVRFYGNNTVGSARDDGCPVIEDDVRVGCGARVLGDIRVGARSVIGANAVVLHDVPPDSVVVGVPGVVVPARPAAARKRRTHAR